jgi:hypothetical protein
MHYAISPVAQLPTKTLYHEVAHVTLGHTAEPDFTDTERTPTSLCEIEPEAVALLCCEALNLEGLDYCQRPGKFLRAAITRLEFLRFH